MVHLGLQRRIVPGGQRSAISRDSQVEETRVIGSSLPFSSDKSTNRKVMVSTATEVPRFLGEDS